ncbi:MULTISPECIES: hypothetical protein [unclassified Halomonas]|uniref:hypothetical protein n=1 Tax=unclassified Halomonas TaxID=2609666 RepID=UPI000D39A114|nr:MULTISPECIES: hypothetical protein [unclassified Halomonas]MCJ8283888.1 hypothetical protein [Halomonas sp.]NQY68941.1 hypothetical protein [Halomonas sp.]
MRRLFGIIFLTICAFFVYTVGLLAFFDVPETGNVKFEVMGEYCIPLAGFLLLGLVVYPGSNWMTLSGITLLSGQAVNVLITFLLISFKRSEELSNVMDTSAFDYFSDYLSGFSIMIGVALLGVILLALGRVYRKSHEALDGVSP